MLMIAEVKEYGTALPCLLFRVVTTLIVPGKGKTKQK